MTFQLDSRSREPLNIFDAYYCFENKEGVVNLIKKYPNELNDDSSIAAIKQFCFPKKSSSWTSSDPVTFFTFALTDGQGLLSFGHCRFSPSKSCCICIITAIPDVAFFKTVLSKLSVASDVDVLLQFLYCSPTPEGEHVLEFDKISFSEKIRDFKTCFNSFNDKQAVMLFNHLSFSSQQLIQLYSSMLKERRILVTATKLDTLTACAFGMLKLIYPFHWQSIFVPVLPYSLIDQLQAPMPYIIGVPKENLENIDLSEFGDLAILDVDNHSFQSDCKDLLPDVIYKFLAKQLKIKDLNLITEPGCLITAFMKATVTMFGRYRVGFHTDGTAIKWDRNRFIGVQPPELRSYVQALVGEDGVQYFERFVDVRLSALNEKQAVMEETDRFMRNFEDYWVDAMSCKNFKDNFQEAVSGMKQNTNAVFGTIKGTMKEAFKNKPSFSGKVRRKKDFNPIQYSFAPPVLNSPDRPEHTTNASTKVFPSDGNEHVLCKEEIKEIPFIIFDDDEVATGQVDPVGAATQNTGALDDLDSLLFDVFNVKDGEQEAGPSSACADKTIPISVKDRVSEIESGKGSVKPNVPFINTNSWETFD